MSTATATPAQGRTIPQIAAEIKRQHDTKVDFLVEGNTLRMKLMELVDAPKPAIAFSCHGPFALTDIAHSQLAETLGIPAFYYHKMRLEAPELLALNVNHWLDEIGPERKMVRTLDEKARAVLSRQYKIIDHVAIFGDVMSYLADAKASIKSSELTDTKLYIRATFPVEGEIRRGDIIRAGIQISNSEVGRGAVATAAWTERLTCLNGAVMQSERFNVRSLHLGGGYSMNGGEHRLYAEDTIEADGKAIALKTRDVIRSASDPKAFDELLSDMRKGTERRLDPVAVTGFATVLPRELGLTKAEALGALDHFITGGDLTQWGLANSITRAAQDASSFDRRVDLETIGGRLLTDADRFRTLENALLDGSSAKGMN